MLKIIKDACRKCELCVKQCPVGSIKIGGDGPDKRVGITGTCVECNICRRVCPFGAIENASLAEGVLVCSSCSVQCKIPPGATGS